MDYKTNTLVSDGYTIFEILIVISISLIIFTGAIMAFLTYGKAQQSSLHELFTARQLLHIDTYLRNETTLLKNEYWKNHDKKINQFVTTMRSVPLPNEGRIIKIDYMFDKNNNVRGLEYHYTIGSDNKEYTSKCLFSFIPISTTKGEAQ